MRDPRESHLAALKRLLRYVRGTVDFSLILHRSPSAELVVYTDADWARCPDTRRSTSGYAVFLGARPSDSRFSPARVLRRSIGLSLTAWLRRPGSDSSWLSFTARSPRALVYCDNVSTVYLSTNSFQHQQTKHVEIDLHFVRDRVAIGDVRVLHVPTTSHFADIFTKGLPSSTFSEFRSSLNVASG
jgi:hypothetical protein